MELETAVEINSVLGHMSIEENEKEVEVAKETIKKAGT